MDVEQRAVIQIDTEDEDVIVPVHHPWRWFACLVVLVILAWAAHGLVTDRAFQWDVVAQYVLSADITLGVLRTLELTVFAMIIGLGLGTVIALMRLSPNSLLTGIAWAYTWFFRSIPVLVQLIFWFNFAALYQSVSLGIPFGPELLTGQTNSLITPMSAALFGLGLSQAAYTAEVIRAGIVAIDPGQTKAAKALGMSTALVFRRIVLPQAMRLIIPPVGNEVISMIKNTSLVSVLALAELLYSAQLIYSRTYQTIPLLIVASLWYLVIVSVLSIGQHFLERRYAHA
ncbi:MAG TPA: amino acid ABC transporter permease [Pseudonocardiaceae bacterium]|nr:amino acid ABC transporter permease [Pseudonocardiaceae bacterium]